MKILIKILKALAFVVAILAGAFVNAMLLLLLIDILSADFLKRQQALMQPCAVGQAYDSRTGRECPKETK